MYNLDINRALKVEEDYLNDKRAGIYYSLEEQLKQIGFKNLEDYFNLKTQYQLKETQLKKIYCGVEEIVDVIHEIFIKKEVSLLIVKSDRIFLYHGDEDYNVDYCKKNNILVHEIGHHGGTIVVGENDISFGIFLPNYITLDFKRDFLKIFYDIISKYYENTKIDNNDILVNGKKVLGATVIKTDDFTGYVTNISFEDNSKLIKKICGNISAIKVPGYLDKTNREVIEEEVIKWLY